MNGSRWTANATVGITSYAQDSLGDIVFVDLPKPGADIEAGKVFGSVESVKAVSDLYSPVTGTVTAVNRDLVTAPEKINTDPHSAWIIKVSFEDPAKLTRCFRLPTTKSLSRKKPGTDSFKRLINRIAFEIHLT